MAKGKKKQVKVTLLRSGIGYTERQKKTILGLGLKRLNGSRLLNDTPAIRGMIGKVSHLLAVEDVEG